MCQIRTAEITQGRGALVGKNFRNRGGGGLARARSCKIGVIKKGSN